MLARVHCTDPGINIKECNSDEELVQVCEQVPLDGQDGDEEAVEKENERCDCNC